MFQQAGFLGGSGFGVSAAAGDQLQQGIKFWPQPVEPDILAALLQGLHRAMQQPCADRIERRDGAAIENQIVYGGPVCLRQLLLQRGDATHRPCTPALYLHGGG